jgi:lipoyl(octanoyl) transferase
MHGFAFNINTDLSYYQFINPCGLTGTGVTSLQKELGKAVGMEEVRQKIVQQFGTLYDIHFAEAN